MVKKINGKMMCGMLTVTLILAGCTGCGGKKAEQMESRSEKKEEREAEANKNLPETTEQIVSGNEVEEPEWADADWAGYFEGRNGAAVVYNAAQKQYAVYNDKTASVQRPPCSTFKIISSLTALECGAVDPDDSVRTWSGEIFWNEDWNKDLDFREAFTSSCVWYFRELIDEIGKERMQEELERLAYGNCDISDWEGKLNTNNSNRALTGFWIESSLAISPKEQVEVMERIFGDGSVYSEHTRNELKKVMLVPETDETDILIYGKTGMGKADGIVVDAWFTGFAEGKEGMIYFCVYLGESEGMEVSSLTAKEIAIRILSSHYGE